MKTLFSMTSLLIAVCLAQASTYASNGACKEATFGGTVKGGQEVTYRIGSNLEVHLAPKGNEGWDISVRPHGTDNDWTLPVNLPISGEAQNLGTGWAETVADNLSKDHSLRFALTKADYDYYWQLAYGPYNRDPNSAASFISKIGKMKAGTILFTPLDFQNDGSPETVKWLRFTIRVTVPRYFQTVGPNWRVIPCADHLLVRD